MSPPPPPPLCFPFQKQKAIAQHPSDSASVASTATLTSYTSKATKLAFTEDTESYYYNPASTSKRPRNPTSPPTSLERKPSSPPARAIWSRGNKQFQDSVTTLVSAESINDHSHWKGNDKPRENVDTSPRLSALRKRMAEEQIDYFIIPSEDGHLSEYVASSERRRQWISGFTGSTGTAIVSKHSAYLFTDSRYWIQAERELDSNWQLQRVGQAGIKDWLEWAIYCPRGSTIGIDSRMISHERASKLFKGLYDRGSKLKHPRQNLVDLVWEDRPKRPKDVIFEQPIEFSGKSAREKLSEIRRYIRQRNALAASSTGGITRSGSSASAAKPTVQRTDTNASKASKATTSTANSSPNNDKITAMFVSNLAAIAHTLNLRGTDVPYNPVFTAYLVVTLERTTLFIDTVKIPKELRQYLAEIGVSVKEYGDVWGWLRDKSWGEGKMIINPSTPYAVSLIMGSARYVVLPSFIEEQKAVKNETEIQGFRDAYLWDGCAMVRWMAWLEDKYKRGFAVTEWEAAQMLNDYRAKGNTLFVGEAYPTISASGPNAALPHYTPTRAYAADIDRKTPYLIDSGGQYRNGTCDTTRTIHLGTPTAEQCEAFTRVLQGHIAIESAIFPSGTTGAQLDVLARKALWKDGLNYLHGTGHGFGSFLNVHEGPQGFGSNTPLEAGHVLTNEPGFYKEGSFGVRIESALVVKKVDTKGQFGGDVWLGFERFTQVPIQTKMVKASLLSKEERQWVKDHNNAVRKVLEPMLIKMDDKLALKWLRRECGRSFGGDNTSGFYIEWD